MKQRLMWNRLEGSFITYKKIWTEGEKQEPPTITDRVLQYLISYYSSPAAARKALRRFYSIDESDFVDLMELRVSDISDIQESLKASGIRRNTFILAFTIKDFLQNTWDTLHTMDLTNEYRDNKEGALKYLRQLRGYPNSWARGETAPFRPGHSSFNRRKLPTENEAVLPTCTIEYLEFLWGINSIPPYEYYTDRIMSRIGLVERKEVRRSKLDKLTDFLGSSPISRHRILITMGKTVCTRNPRCEKCPISSFCFTYKNNNV